VFLADGDEGMYLAWAGTALAAAIDGVYARSGVVAGAGAGAAALGQFAYDERAASGVDLDSATALANPYAPSIAFVHDAFHIPTLNGTIVDAHFHQQARFGRLAVFMARQLADGSVVSAAPVVTGIGVDEQNALAIDRFGIATQLERDGADGATYFVRGGTPQRAVAGQPLGYAGLRVWRLDAARETLDPGRGCGTAFQYSVSIDATKSPAFTPADPYGAAGSATLCPL
jgi:cyanophycinase-like exopeptidase